LGLTVGEETDEGATLRVAWKPFPDMRSGVTGDISEPQNIKDGSLAAMKKDIDQATSVNQMDHYYRLTPMDPKKEMSVRARVESTSKVAVIPPLNGPRVVEERIRIHQWQWWAISGGGTAVLTTKTNRPS
jgi:hypothetical protein